MPYVDGFVIPIPKKNMAAYRKLARKTSKIWREHGALEYRECVGDDLAAHCGPGFPRQVKLKPGETVVLAWIVYRSRAHRDRVNAKAMADERMAKLSPEDLPFDPERMVHGGFKVIVDA